MTATCDNSMTVWIDGEQVPSSPSDSVWEQNTRILIPDGQSWGPVGLGGLVIWRNVRIKMYPQTS